MSHWSLFAEALSAWALEAAALSLSLFVAVALLWKVIQRRASAHFGHLLFLVPLVPLISPSVLKFELPLLPPAPAGLAEVGSLRGDGPATVEMNRDVSAPAGGELQLRDELRASAPAPILQGREESAPVASTLTWHVWAVSLWALIALTLLTRFLLEQVLTFRRIASSPELGGAEGERVRGLIEELSERVGLRREVRVVLNEDVVTPAVWGVLRPVLVLREGLSNSMSKAQLEVVLLHELAHLRRGDLLVATAQRLVELVWFFHPSAIFSGRMANGLREEACDETAMALSVGSPRRTFPDVLVHLATQQSAHVSHMATPFIPLHNHKSIMKKRIQRMLESDRAPLSRTSLGGATVALLIAAPAFVSVGHAEQSDGSTGGVVVVEGASEESAAANTAEAVIQASVAWLISQQAEDGSWSTGPDTNEPTGELNSIGVTGLALMAIEMEAAQGEVSAAQREAILSGRRYLRSSQGEGGIFGEVSGFRFMQSHAVATLAWLKTERFAPSEGVRPESQRAVGAILKAQNPYAGGWRFSGEPDGDQDTLTTGLMMRTLKEAQDAGVEIPAKRRDWALKYIDTMTHPETGRTGYYGVGSRDPRFPAKSDEFSADLTEQCTAMALRTRLAWGEEIESSAALRKGAILLSQSPPRWDVEAGCIDYYYWLFGTEALSSMQGVLFFEWRDSLHQALIPNQVRGEEGGHWPAIDAWSTEGTSVHSTALCTLALQFARSAGPDPAGEKNVRAGAVQEFDFNVALAHLSAVSTDLGSEARAKHQRAIDALIARAQKAGMSREAFERERDELLERAWLEPRAKRGD